MMQFIDLGKQQQRIRSSLDKHMARVLEHGQYIMGPEVKELEEKLAAYVGTKHCIGVANGTDALLIAMMALGIGPGDEVITSPFSFIAAAEMVLVLRAKPVFVDIDEKTFNLDPSKLEKAITPKTRVIIPVDLYGQCANYRKIQAIAEKHGLPIIEDAAQSLGATHHGKQACNITKIGCTSFFPTKPLGCYGDGGACFTSDDSLAEKMRQIRVHGQTGKYVHPVVGLNGRLDTLQAAVLLAKMEVFADEVSARAQIGRKLSARLSDYVMPPYLEEGNTSVYGQFTVRVKNRQKFIDTLKENGVPTAVHYPTTIHLQGACASLNLKKGDFPISEKAAEEVVSLPFHPYLEEKDIEQIVMAVRNAK